MRRSLRAGGLREDAVRFLIADREFHGCRAAGNDVRWQTSLSLHNHLLDHRRRIPPPRRNGGQH
jgi:hypothetical protein